MPDRGGLGDQYKTSIALSDNFTFSLIGVCETVREVHNQTPGSAGRSSSNSSLDPVPTDTSIIMLYLTLTFQ